MACNINNYYGKKKFENRSERSDYGGRGGYYILCTRVTRTRISGCICGRGVRLQVFGYQLITIDQLGNEHTIFN